jgi:hypothetical protein
MVGNGKGVAEATAATIEVGLAGTVTGKIGVGKGSSVDRNSQAAARLPSNRHSNHKGRLQLITILFPNQN